MDGGGDDPVRVVVSDGLLRLQYYTACHMHNLKYDLPQAVMIAEKLAADTERLRSQDDGAILEAQNTLALAYQDMARYDDAIELLKQVLADRERLFGPGDKSTLYSCLNLGNAYQDAGRTAEAIQLHERALAGHELLAPDGEDAIVVMNSLATAYHDVGRTEDAIALLEQAVARQQQVDDDEESHGVASARGVHEASRHQPAAQPSPVVVSAPRVSRDPA